MDFKIKKKVELVDDLNIITKFNYPISILLKLAILENLSLIPFVSPIKIMFKPISTFKKIPNFTRFILIILSNINPI